MTPIYIYLTIAAVLGVVTLLATVISYFDKTVSMQTSRLWARGFFLSLIWPVAFILLIVAVFIWAFGSEDTRARVFG